MKTKSEVGNLDEHSKKKIAPVVITVCSVLYYALFFGVLLACLPGIFKIIFGVIPLLIALGMVYVCYERIKEIDGGEEDDISKY